MKKAVGIICEFNPFHNGHLYFINEVKRLFPEHIIILVLNGYFLERGEVSVLTKEMKTSTALEYGVDIVVDHGVIFGTQSADAFAESALILLNNFKIEHLVFGSECNNPQTLKKIANTQLNDDLYHKRVIRLLKTGVNYPTAMAKALKIDDFEFTPNDLLGISYTKAILKNNFNINVHTIKRSNDFHDNESNSEIVSASNIRLKLSNEVPIDKYVPKGIESCIVEIDFKKLFNFIKFKILTEKDLSIYLDVDEGIENKLKKDILLSFNISDLKDNVKTKRYTYNKINRMLTHILLGITKEDIKNAKYDYVHLLGFNDIGKKYINSIKKDIVLPLNINKDSLIYKYELISAYIYELITNTDVSNFELKGKPLYK